MKSDSTPIISGNKRGREDGLDQLMQPAPDTYGIRTGQYAAKLSERIELAAAFDALQSSRGMSSPTQQLARLGVRGVHPATTDIQMLLIAAEARKDPKLQQLSGDPLSLQNVGVFDAIQAEVVGYIVNSIVEKCLAEQVSDNNVKQPLVIPRHVLNRYDVTEIIPFDPMAQAA